MLRERVCSTDLSAGTMPGRAVSCWLLEGKGKIVIIYQVDRPTQHYYCLTLTPHLTQKIVHPTPPKLLTLFPILSSSLPPLSLTLSFLFFPHFLSYSSSPSPLTFLTNISHSILPLYPTQPPSGSRHKIRATADFFLLPGNKLDRFRSQTD